MNEDEVKAVVAQAGEDADAAPPITEFAQLAMATFQAGGAGVNAEVAKQVRAEHMTQALENADRAHERVGVDSKDARRFRLATVCTALSAIVLLIALFLFSGNVAILESHLDAMIGVVLGAFGGYGFGSRQT